MKERQRNSLGRTIYLSPGDILRCRVQDRETNEEITFTEEIGRTINIDTVVTFDVEEGEEVLGLTDGIGAIFGKAK
jgi:hypothetical protein